MSTARIDRMMEQASQALVARDYLQCEKLCLDAMQLSRQQSDYERYARILMPLQEARRQRRQIASDAGVFVLSGRRLQPQSILRRHRAGCLLLIDPPYSEDDEKALRDAAVRRRLYVEIMRLSVDQMRSTYLTVMEDRGDAALATVTDNATPTEQVAALEQIMQRVGDHEIAHQRLAEAARRAASP